jgi:hypothetical protein
MLGSCRPDSPILGWIEFVAFSVPSWPTGRVLERGRQLHHQQQRLDTMDVPVDGVYRVLINPWDIDAVETRITDVPERFSPLS